MLYFSKLRIFTILIASLFFLFFTLSNFTKLDDSFFNKKINLGLDLQGGSYLLLEIDNKPVITKELQNKITFLKTYFKDKNINIFNLKIYNQNSIRFETDETNVELCINVDRTSEPVPLIQDIASKIDAKRVKNGVPEVDQKVSNRTLMFWGTG